MCGTYLINNDDIVENFENFNVILTSREDRVTVDPAEGTVTILDDDGEGTTGVRSRWE